MEFPNVIVGIGGAGKRLIFSLLNKEWILENLLRPRLDGVKNYNIHIIDTALEEENQDLFEKRRLETKIDNIKNKYIEAGEGIPNNIIIDYQLFTKNMNLLGTSSLMKKGVIDDIKKETNIKYWWFDPSVIGKESMKILNEVEQFSTLSFSSGVFRRRALGKAIFYKALCNKNAQVILNQIGKVAIIVGLGGGTGSGIFIDFAKKLKEIAIVDTTVFGIMPTSNESEKERANGYTSLCELEYLQMQGELNKYFDHVVLLSMEPTGYKGHINVDDSTKDMIKEFHESFVYTFTSYYGLAGDVQMISGMPRKFSQFVTATSCVIRYNVETNKNIVISFNDALLSRKDAISIEDGSNEELTAFLKDNSNGELKKEDNDWLEKRLKSFKTLLENETGYISDMGYQSINVFTSAIKDAEDRDPKASIADKISAIFAQFKVTKMLNPGDYIDTPLQDLAIKELSMLDKSAKLLSKINTIDTFDEKKILKDILKKEEVSGSSITLIQDEIKKILTDSSKISNDRIVTNNKCQQYKDDIESKIIDIKNNISTHIRNNLDEINELENDDNKRRIRARLDDLNKLFSDYIVKINTCKRPKELDVITTASIKDAAEEFSSSLRNIDNISMTDITKSADDIKECKKFMIMRKKKLSLIDIILKFFGIETANVKKRNNAITEIGRILGRGNKVFKNIERTDNFEIIFKYDLDDKIQLRKGKLINNISSKIKEVVSANIGSELNSEQEEMIKSSIRGKESNLGIDKAVKGAINYQNKIKEYEENINRLDSNLKKLENKKISFEKLSMLYEENPERLLSYRSKMKSYDSNIDKFKTLVKQRRGFRRDDSRYVFEIEPIIRSGVIGRDNISLLLQSEGDERASIMTDITRGIDHKLCDVNYNGFLNRYITYGPAHTWTVDMTYLCISSIANIDIAQIRNSVSVAKLFGMDNDHVGSRILNHGDRWDVGCTLFVAGTFLDNIEAMASPTRGYYDSYKQIEKRIGKAIFIHHTHMLEDGNFVHRPIIPISNNKKLLTGDSKDVDNHIKGIYKIQSYIGSDVESIKSDVEKQPDVNIPPNDNDKKINGNNENIENNENHV